MKWPIAAPAIEMTAVPVGDVTIETEARDDLTAIVVGKRAVIVRDGHLLMIETIAVIAGRDEVSGEERGMVRGIRGSTPEMIAACGMMVRAMTGLDTIADSQIVEIIAPVAPDREIANSPSGRIIGAEKDTVPAGSVPAISTANITPDHGRRRMVTSVDRAAAERNRSRGDRGPIMAPARSRRCDARSINSVTRSSSCAKKRGVVATASLAGNSEVGRIAADQIIAAPMPTVARDRGIADREPIVAPAVKAAPEANGAVARDVDRAGPREIAGKAPRVARQMTTVAPVAPAPAARP